MEVLINRMGLWYEYAPLIPSLTQEGFTPATLEEITGIASSEQNRLVVASQVRESLIESTDPDTVSYFDPPGYSELLYEIRLLNNQQRASAARFIIAQKFDGKETQELAKAMKDFPRRYGDRGWESFNRNLPGDCLGFMYFRQAQEHKTASSPELSKAALERALQVVESDKAKKRVEEELERKGGEGIGEGDVDSDVLVRVPVVRMAVGEVAESSVVAILPVCKAEGREIELEAAPWECGMGGEFGVLEAEKGWTRWVVLPGWEPVATLKRGGVAVLFPKAKGVLAWKGKKRETDEEILVVADRGRTEVAADDGFYLVASGGNGSAEEGLKVEKGVKLKEMGVEKSLGTVVLVVRPPREENEDQLADDDWE
ncbi:Rubisco accumulation factor 2 [Forsythia ovata]|uniref:Rubisco accumulation factor 2 n=1 Tax=Forsythia ovata TaxID=205694 RepID=A0ABD1WHS4_9LAMI